MPTPLVLTSTEVVSTTPPPAAPEPAVTPIHVVTVSVPGSPTLVDGIPQ